MDEASLAQAQLALQSLESDAKEKRRQESNMTYFMKKSGEIPPGVVLRGDRRRHFLLVWLAKQAQEAATEANQQTEECFEKTNAYLLDESFLSRFQIIKEFGGVRGTDMIENGNLDTRPCRYTGKEGPDHTEYKVWDDHEVGSKTKREKTSINTNKKLEGEAVEAAQGAVRDIAGNFIKRLACEKPNEDDDDQPLVTKNDPPQVANPLASLSIMKDPMATLKSLQAAELDLKVLCDDAKQIRYASQLGVDIESFIPKFAGATKGMEKLVRTADRDIVNIAEARRLNEKVDHLFQKAEEFRQWAGKFGVKVSSKRKRPF